jgi:phage protein D
MAYTLVCEVRIGRGAQWRYLFRKVAEVTITRTWRNLSDECTIRLPSLARMLERDVQTGDTVEVKLGYEGYALQTEFSGFVAEVMPTIPLGLRCEDAMYALKRREVTPKTWRQTTLRDVLQYVVPDARIGKVPAIALAPFRLDRVTAFEVLRKLKDEYGLAAYFRDGVLFVGLPYTEFENPRRVIYDLQRTISANNLTYRRREDVRMGAKVVGIRPNNKRVTTHVGDSDGEQRTFHYRLDATQNEAAAVRALRELGEAELAKYRYEGYRGTVSAFGLPHVIHGEVADLRDNLYPARSGRYLVDKVVTTFGTGGFRREVEVGPKASATA